MMDLIRDKIVELEGRIARLETMLTPPAPTPAVNPPSGPSPYGLMGLEPAPDETEKVRGGK